MLGHHSELCVLGSFFFFVFARPRFLCIKLFYQMCLFFLVFCFEKRKKGFSFFFGPITLLFSSLPLLLLLQYLPRSLISVVSIAVHKSEREREKSLGVWCEIEFCCGVRGNEGWFVGERCERKTVLSPFFLVLYQDRIVLVKE